MPYKNAAGNVTKILKLFDLRKLRNIEIKGNIVTNLVNIVVKEFITF